MTPPTIGITGAWTPLNQVLVNPGINTISDGFAASYFWNGGTQTVDDENHCCGTMDYGLGINRNDLGDSRYFGFQVSCIMSSGCSGFVGGGQALDVRGIQLTAEDNTPPSVVPVGNNLWYQTSLWARGTWPISFESADDSGVCSMSATVDGQPFQGPTASNNQSSWTQCPTPQTMNQTIDTASYPDGDLTLQLTAQDAASPANVSAPSETVHVDNQPVILQLTGPSDALSTAGTQYVDAVASAGPSGVNDIQCSADGAPFQVYTGNAAQIPVEGTGQHSVSCFAQNNAIDAQGNRGATALQTWQLGIRQPTAAGISFGSRLVDALRCRRESVRVVIPAHWVTLHRHGRRIRVHHRSRSRIQREVRCHPRVVVRKVRGPGGVHRKRFVLLPHTIAPTQLRIPFGHASSVGGWVGLADGTALPGVPVAVMSATDNGLGRWHQTEVTTTGADGTWSAELAPGPSRLIEAVYPGSDTAEPATSGQVRLTVRTKVLLSIHPRVVRWGHTIKISGRVLGRNIPAGKLLRLRIGTARAYSTVGIPDINADGRFRTTWTFAPGHGVVRYWFSVTTLPEADYPYAQSGSRRVYVTVQG